MLGEAAKRPRPADVVRALESAQPAAGYRTNRADPTVSGRARSRSRNRSRSRDRTLPPFGIGMPQVLSALAAMSRRAVPAATPEPEIEENAREPNEYTEWEVDYDIIDDGKGSFQMSAD